MSEYICDDRKDYADFIAEVQNMTNDERAKLIEKLESEKQTKTAPK